MQVKKTAPTSLPKPPWLKIKPANDQSPGMSRFRQIKQRVKELNLNTVCAEAHCPNMAECWSQGTATFMIMGDTCTRGCRFCNVKTGNPDKKLDIWEPLSLAQAIKEMDLDYAVVTSVDRDDLADQGAGHFAKCIETVKKRSPKTLLEVLIPDFSGREDLLDLVIKAEPKVIAQNLETVERLTTAVRDIRAGYGKTLEVLKYIKSQAPHIYTKSALMVGLGETEEEVFQAMKDLRAHGVDFLTIGQYLQPSSRHFPLQEYVKPEQFANYEKIALELGFLYAFCGPFVRSSYKAGEYWLLRRE